jgi:hypothetical protein
VARPAPALDFDDVIERPENAALDPRVGRADPEHCQQSASLVRADVRDPPLLIANPDQIGLRNLHR